MSPRAVHSPEQRKDNCVVPYRSCRSPRADDDFWSLVDSYCRRLVWRIRPTHVDGPCSGRSNWPTASAASCVDAASGGPIASCRSGHMGRSVSQFMRRMREVLFVTAAGVEYLRVGDSSYLYRLTGTDASIFDSRGLL